MEGARNLTGGEPLSFQCQADVVVSERIEAGESMRVRVTLIRNRLTIYITTGEETTPVSDKTTLMPIVVGTKMDVEAEAQRPELLLLTNFPAWPSQ